MTSIARKFDKKIFRRNETIFSDFKSIERRNTFESPLSKESPDAVSSQCTHLLYTEMVKLNRNHKNIVDGEE